MATRLVLFYQIHLTAKKPAEEPYLAYPTKLECLGEHIRKRRLDLKLTAREVGKRLGVNMNTVYKWEYHREYPHPRVYGMIVEFLGYEPDVLARRYCGEKILAYRKLHGISQSRFARKLGIHITTLRQWEKNRRCPKKEFFEKLSLILDGDWPEEKNK